MLTLTSADLVRLMQDALARGASFRFIATGASMSPFIRDGDEITISSPRSPARIGDVVAFTHPGTDCLLVHRVVAFRRGGFLTRGDNSTAADRGVPRSAVLGRLSRVERNDRTVRLGMGPERRLIAWLSRFGLLRPLLLPARKAYRWFAPR